jgi:hypothetical protein
MTTRALVEAGRAVGETVRLWRRASRGVGWEKTGQLAEIVRYTGVVADSGVTFIADRRIADVENVRDW